MKKFTLFLSALFISVMSFATEVSFDFSAQGYADKTEMKSVTLNDDVTITFNKGTNNNTPKYYTNGNAARVYGGNYFTVTTTSGKFTKIELTFGTSDGSNAITTDVGNFATNTWTGTEASVKFTVGGTSGNRRLKAIKVTYGEVADNFVSAPTISGDVDFIESTTIAVVVEEGLKAYYTIDGTEPTSASAEYTAPFNVTATTTVKAIAYKGENASEVTTQTFTKATAVTCAEAAELAMKVSANNVPTELTYVVVGYVTNVVGDLSSGKQTFWIADTKDGGKVFEAYYCFTSKAVKVGDKVQLFGKLTKYNSTPEMSNGQVTILPADPEIKITSEVKTGTDELGDPYKYIDFGTIEYGQTDSLILSFEAVGLPAKAISYPDGFTPEESDNFVTFRLDTYPFFEVTNIVGGAVEVTEDWMGNPQESYTFPIAADGTAKGSVTLAVKKDFGVDPFDEVNGYGLPADSSIAVGSVVFMDQTYQNYSDMLAVMIELTKPEVVAEIKITSELKTDTDEEGNPLSYVDFGTVEYGQTATVAISFEAKNLPAKAISYDMETGEQSEVDNYVSCILMNADMFFEVTLSEGGKTETGFMGTMYTFPIAEDGSAKGTVTLTLKSEFEMDPFDEMELVEGELTALDMFMVMDQTYQNRSEMIYVAATLTKPATALENATVDTDKAYKVIENGVVYIIKNGVKYTLLGTVVK